MLKKHIDMALVGKNYLSILLSLELLRRGQDVLLLDDERMGMGELYTDHLYSLEKEYLKVWGLERQLPPLENMESYLKTAPTVFVFDRVRLRLGDSPARNYRELMRKIPEIFPSIDVVSHNIEDIEKFNRMYSDYCATLGKTAYRYKNVQSLNLEAFLSRCPPVLLSLYDSLRATLEIDAVKNEKVYWKFKTFLYMAQGLFQKKFSSNIRPVELFHLLLCLVSPHYELNRKAFLDDLIGVNGQRGGQFKRTSIREWMFYRGRPWSVELASYEGIIHPKKMAFVGGVPQGMLVRLRPLIRHYISLNIKLTYPRGAARGLCGERVVCSSLDKLGTDIPMWVGSFGEEQAFLKMFVLFNLGRKVDFIRQRVEQSLERDFDKLLPGLMGRSTLSVMGFGGEVWVDANWNFAGAKESRPKAQEEVRLVDLSHPARRRLLKNVYYFGPYRELPLGVLSTLMEINDQQQFM